MSEMATTVEQLTNVEMPKADVITDAKTGVASVSTDQLPPRDFNSRHEQNNDHEEDKLPDVPDEHGIYDLKPGEHLDTDDMSGEKNLYLNKSTPFDTSSLSEEELEILSEELKDRTVVDLAKRVKGMRQQISQIKNAPEEYSVDIDPEIAEYFHIEQDDPLITQFKEKALAANISQDNFNELLNMYLEHQSAEAIAQMEAQEAEFERLGIDPDATYNRLSTWAKSNLSQEDAEIMSGMSLTPSQMKVMTSIINKFAGSYNMPDNLETDTEYDQDKRLAELNKYMQGGVGTLQRINKLYGIDKKR